MRVYWEKMENPNSHEQFTSGISPPFGWSWGRATLETVHDLALVLGDPDQEPFGPLSWAGRSELAGQALNNWMSEREWLAVDLAQAGYLWLRVSGDVPRAPAPKEVESLWMELRVWGAQLEASQIDGSIGNMAGMCREAEERGWL